MESDVIVVGAGPAGSVLAYLLAKRGLKILLIEKETLPRCKPCGGGIPWKTVRSLPVDVSPALELEARWGILSYSGRQMLHVPLKDFGWLTMRDRFDYFLVQEAVKAGAILLEGLAVYRLEEEDERIAVYTGKDTCYARLVVGADGVNSKVAVCSGLLQNRETGTALEAELEVSPAILAEYGSTVIFDFGALEQGYGWIFFKRDHLSAGVFRARSGSAGNMKRQLVQFLSQQPMLDSYRAMTVQGHRIPLGGAFQPLHHGRVLLVGDAANLADAWIGEGIYHAVRSAHIAAEEIPAILESSPFDASRYTRRVHAEIVSELKAARRFARLVYNYPWQCSVALTRSPQMQKIVFGNIRGDVSLQDMLGQLLITSPRILYEVLRNRKLASLQHAKAVETL